MSDTENMEKEFTVDELAGGESLVDDLTDDEYVEALGEHDGDGKAGEEEDDEEKKEEKVNAVVSGKDKVKDVDSIEGEQEKKDVQENNEVSKQADKALDDDKRNPQYISKKEAFYEDGDNEEVREEEEDDGEDEEEDDEEEGEEEENVDEGEDVEEDEESIEGEQEENDGQENNEVSKQADKALDDDEDRRNPQYIPKRGAFYEHDDRLGTDDEVDEEKEPEKTETLEKKSEPTVEVRKTKKLWSDDGKWGHDMFDNNEQKPKPRDEIISTYGYDIRNEDGPPKARRRRRYGRGPNRYTRSWKDEGAYSNSNETPNKGKVKADENTKREKEQGLVKSLDSDDKRLVNNRRSGSRGRGRNEPKTVPKGSDREKEGPGLHHERERERDRDLDRDRDHRKYNYNRSPGPSKDHREAAIRSDRDLKRNQKDFSVNDFPELPLKSREKIRPMSHVTTGELNQPNAWSKSRPKPSSARENIRDSEGPEDYKTEPMKVVEAIENGKRTFNLSDNNSKIEVVKTQTFENSRYFSRRNPTKGHHPEPTIVKKDAPLHRSNRGRNRPIDRDFRNSGELGRPITKTSHLSDDYEVDLTSGSGSMEQQRRGRYNMSKDRGELRDFRGNLHDDRDRRGSDEPRGRNYNDDRHYDGHFNETQADISVGLSKLTLDKSRLAENDPNNLSKPKRYSSLRQHQTQIQQQHQLKQSEPLPQHQHPQQQQQQQQHKQPQQQQTREIQNSTLNQYPSTSQHLNLNHSRQSANVQYYEANSGANQQPSASYYIDNRSPQSSFGFIPTTNIEGAPNSTRFLSQIAPRFIPPPPAPPPPPSEPRFMAQAVAAAAAANPATAGTGTLPSVISGPPAATYLPTYPPGYPQYPPPPPQAAQFSIAPPPPPAAPEMYRGGVTYYDTMTQQVSLRQLPQRRPKNALPIVPPSDLSNSDVTGYDDQNDLNQNVETVSCLCE